MFYLVETLSREIQTKPRAISQTGMQFKRNT